MVAAVIVAALIVSNGGEQQQTTPPASNSNNNVDLCNLVDGQASFTGQRMFLSGTAVTTEYVRVLKENGGTMKDLAQTSLNSGTLATAPAGKYKLYYGENSTTYYTTAESYTAPCQDATDDKVGTICLIDTTPTITVFDENGQVQAVGGTNAQAVGASDVIDVEVKVKVAADSCYGAPGSGKKNAICFYYNGTTFDSVKASTPVSSIPYSIASDASKNSGYSQSCYELDLLQDTGFQVVTVTLDASATQPTSSNHNINISIEDVDYDLNQDTLTEIIGFEDESNNNLGSTTIVRGSIQVS